ncbi:MFS transporter [Bacillus sp. CMF21]|uniref:MFS transporter n=1 Tax=Metabacillus dongyingensis TaxID=2874282 RepID=UPI001CC1A9DD|nr:MFS transporter [Metabacillus dongyingensis]UAL53028.1 MFS transporter [Metabacillus dongyingensis]UOK58605.1 MFS transporter [Bacillus sp. OVS6]USK29348.1 MFS transporter [Bacillus sp. CMF21]
MEDSKRNDQNQKVITMVAIITALSLLGDSMLYIALPIFWREAGLDSIWQVGILLSINRFIRLPFNPIAGWIYKKISLKTGLIIAIIIGAFTTLGYGVFKGFIAWIILRGLWGIAWSFFRIGGLSCVALYADENHRGEAMGLYNGIYRLGSLFGMLLGGLFVPVLGLTLVSIVFGMLTLVGLPLILFSFTKKNDAQKDTKSDPLMPAALSFVFKRKLLIIISGFFITLLIQGVLTSTLTSLIDYHYGQEISFFGLIVSVTFLSGMIQSARWMWEPFLGRKIGFLSDGPNGRIPLFIFSCIFTAVLFGMISYTLPIWLWTIVMLSVLLGATAISTLSDALAIDAAKSANVVSFLTLYSIVQDVGAALGPFLSYMLIELNRGFIFLYWGGACVFTAIGLLWFLLYLDEKTAGSIHNLHS